MNHLYCIFANVCRKPKSMKNCSNLFRKRCIVFAISNTKPNEKLQRHGQRENRRPKQNNLKKVLVEGSTSAKGQGLAAFQAPQRLLCDLARVLILGVMSTYAILQFMGKTKKPHKQIRCHWMGSQKPYREAHDINYIYMTCEGKK